VAEPAHLAFTIAAEIGDIERFPSPEKLADYTAFARASISQETRIAAAR
jgi:transposase